MDQRLLNEMAQRRMQGRSQARMAEMPYGQQMQERYIEPRVNQMNMMLPQQRQPQLTGGGWEPPQEMNRPQRGPRGWQVPPGMRGM